MTASQALNETRLPRAVLRRSAEIEARYAESKSAPAAIAATPAEVTNPPQDLTQQPEASDPRESDPGYWKQRFKVTEGVLRAERDRHSTAIGALRQQISELQEQARSLQASKTQPDAVEVSAYFSPDQIEQFGEEQCQAMADAAHKAAQKHVQAAVEAEIKPLRDRRKAEEADETTRREQQFSDALTALVPNYLEVDVSPGWLEWLAQDDPSTGIVRQTILDSHVAKRDATKVAGMFKKFAADSKPTALTPPMAPHGTGGSGGGSAPEESEAAKAGYPSPAEMKDYFKRAGLPATSRYAVSEAERAQFEARLKLKRA